MLDDNGDDDNNDDDVGGINEDRNNGDDGDVLSTGHLVEIAAAPGQDELRRG